MKDFKYRYTSKTETVIGKHLLRNTDLHYYFRKIKDTYPELSREQVIYILLEQIEIRIKELIK